MNDEPSQNMRTPETFFIGDAGIAAEEQSKKPVAGEEQKEQPDYEKMMRIVCEKHNYHGYVGIEYEGGKVGEMEGIRKSKALLETISKKLTKAG